MVDVAKPDLDTPPDKLPVLKSVKQAYVAFFENFSALLKISAPWLILTGGTSYFSLAILRTLFTTEGAGASNLVLVPVLNVALNLLFMLAGATMAVAWHRLLLLGEGPNVGGNFVSSPVWRYLGAGIAMFVVALLPAGLVLLPTMLFFFPVHQPLNRS